MGSKMSKLNVLNMVGRGMTNGEIGKALGLSEKTVKAHVTDLMKNYKVRNRVELALSYHGVQITDVEVAA